MEVSSKKTFILQDCTKRENLAILLPIGVPYTKSFTLVPDLEEIFICVRKFLPHCNMDVEHDGERLQTHL